jgi:hypothetical protein
VGLLFAPTDVSGLYPLVAALLAVTAIHEAVEAIYILSHEIRTPPSRY